MQRWFFILSLSIHTFGLLWFLRSHLPPLREVSQPIFIEIQEKQLPKQSSKSSATGFGAQQKLSNNGTRHNSFEKYLPHYQLTPGHPVATDDRQTYLLNSKRDNPRSDWGSGAATFERIADANIYQRLYEHIDGSLSYPGVLARHKIKGIVFARIVLNQGGECDWKFTQISSREPYLQLYVLDLLKRVCRQNYKDSIHGREITNVDVSFQFDINENNDRERVEKQKIIVGNALFFYRNSHQSVTEWELGPFKGIFPVPMVYLNLPWIQENWDRLIKQKDPLNEFKKEFGGT